MGRGGPCGYRSAHMTVLRLSLTAWSLASLIDTHDKADDLSDRLLHGHLGIVRDLRMPVAAQLPGHDLCDIGNGKESILLADSLVGLLKYISRRRLLRRWSSVVAPVAAAVLFVCGPSSGVGDGSLVCGAVACTGTLRGGSIDELPLHVLLQIPTANQ